MYPQPHTPRESDMKIEDLNDKDKIALFKKVKERYPWCTKPHNIKRLCQQLLDRGKYVPHTNFEKENTNDLT